MRSLFETLYYGDYSVFDQYATTALLQKEEACNRFYDKIREQFGLEFLDQLNKASNDATEAALLSIYIHGVRFGGRFMLELLAEGTGNSEADT